ncbi:FAD-dependent oxidoreductase [Paracraurococcus ruber]|uniref:FAD-dependent oxidoreductase n=1 Tax=Paracraurococcus ruber TaxID=77675 RepID=UPI001F02BAA9|nr:FAD-dependent oxidoreductase [Paracraurococcus ruber]
MLTVDLLVAGSGAGGMTAAIAARHHGLDVLVAEKEPVFGGTTAMSGGYLWVPNNPVNAAAGTRDSVEAARAYLRHEAGNHFDAPRIDAFLRDGPRMVDFMHAHTQVRFGPATAFSDYHPDAPGGTPGGRSILTEPLDARALGRDLPKLRRPRPELTLFGLAIGSGKELWHFYRATRRLESALYVTKRLARHGVDLALHGRGMTLTNGNALAARLYLTAQRMGIGLRLGSPVTRLLRDESGAVTGAVLATPEGALEVMARRGVVLACGGFPADLARRKRLFNHPAAEGEHWSAANPANTGDGIRLGEAIGAAVEEDYPNAAAWAPTSLVPRADGTLAPFPHFIDRGKPGVIAVLRSGQRFVNEANSYHDFVQGMIRACPPGQPAEAFLLLDHRTIRRYGIGFVKAAPIPLGPAIASGYLKRGETLAELAAAAGIDAAALEHTVAVWNADVARGEDRDFGKGSTAYNRFHGDPEVTPNPCLAPLAVPPFYAVRVVPGDIGTFDGLRADEHARVLDRGGAPIPGLYAAGNDMASIMGGNYPGGGITLGPAMTFGFIAGRHAAGAMD